MQIVNCVSGLRERVAEFRRDGARIGFVPTMGNLHAGHYSLIEEAHLHASIVVASIFVNPTQFGPNEDFARYPRTPEADAEGLAAAGCDLLFLPNAEAIYPFGIEDSVRVRVPQVSETLDGALRPGHFDGVATVVARLFNLVQPDVAVFGRKDYQQLLVIRRLVADLGFPIEIVGAPIVREESGLAMSSRNQYLNAAERERAAEIIATLIRMRERMAEGASVSDVEADAMLRLRDKGFVPDYAVVRNASNLDKLTEVGDSERVALIAARLGPTRLIDNLQIDSGPEIGV